MHKSKGTNIQLFLKKMYICPISLSRIIPTCPLWPFLDLFLDQGLLPKSLHNSKKLVFYSNLMLQNTLHSFTKTVKNGKNNNKKIKTQNNKKSFSCQHDICDFAVPLNTCNQTWGNPFWGGLVDKFSLLLCIYSLRSLLLMVWGQLHQDLLKEFQRFLLHRVRDDDSNTWAYQGKLG